MAAVLNDQSGDFRVAMDDPYDLILGMFALAVTAVMLVAGELYLVTRPAQPETYAPPASIVTSSIRKRLAACTQRTERPRADFFGEKPRPASAGP